MTPCPSKASRLQVFLDYVSENSFDVIMLQELFVVRTGPLLGYDYLRTVIEGLHKLGFSYFDVGGAQRFFADVELGQNCGLFIASKIPLADPYFERIAPDVRSESLTAKGFQAVTLQLEQPIRLVNVHTEPRSTASKRSQMG